VAYISVGVKGYLWRSLKSPVPIVIGIPMMMHSLTPETQTQCSRWRSTPQQIQPWISLLVRDQPLYSLDPNCFICETHHYFGFTSRDWLEIN